MYVLLILLIVRWFFSLSSHIQTVGIQQEIIHADDQDAVLGVPGGRSIFDHDNFLEGIVDAQQRVGFLLQLCIVGDGKG